LKTRTAWIWIVLGGAAFGLHLLLGRESTLAETLYARGLFVGLRWIWDMILGWSPIPIIYLTAAFAAIWIAVRLIRRFSRPRSKMRISRTRKIGRAALVMGAWIGGLVFLFYFLWGFNYHRLGIDKHLGLDISFLGPVELAAETDWALRGAADSRAAIPGSSAAALGENILPAKLEPAIRNDLSRILKEAGYPVPGRVRIRSFRPGGWMMRFSGSGIYLPYFGEGYMAAALLAFEKPFTMAHEMAHGLGITDEGEANFLAFLACRTSADPVVRYSGFISYWDYAAGELAAAAPAEFKTLWAGIPEGIKSDLRAQRRNWDRYRGPLEKISQKVYEKYLKSQGIDEGMKSYSRFLNLVSAWKKRKGIS
jgi:hypothetical protein